jgi:hypothetical protein
MFTAPRQSANDNERNNKKMTHLELIVDNVMAIGELDWLSVALQQCCFLCTATVLFFALQHRCFLHYSSADFGHCNSARF